MSEYSLPWKDEDVSISISTDPPSESMDPFLTLFAEVTVTCPELCKELDRYPSVSLAPTEYRHITIKQIGEYNEDIDCISEDIKRSLSEVRPFDISLSGVDVFPNCVYIPVQEGKESLENLHNTICSIEELPINSFEAESYKPHMTVGKFVEQPSEEVFQILNDFRDTEWGTMKIDSLHLVKNGTQQVGPFSTFQSVEDFDIAEEIVVSDD
jgi:2'-5' RNA ligase